VFNADWTTSLSKIDPQSEQLNGINLSLSKIDPQSEQLNGIDLLGLVALATLLEYSNRQPVTAVFRLDNQPIKDRSAVGTTGRYRAIRKHRKYFTLAPATMADGSIPTNNAKITMARAIRG
jgi:hypothetical protein